MRVHRFLRLPLLAASLLLVARAASAQENEPTPIAAPEPPPPRFGARGQLVLGGGSSIGVSSTQYSTQASRLSAGFSPDLDYFFLRNVSIGLNVNVSYADSKGYGTDGSLVESTSTSLMAGPRFGWNIPLGDHVSWWLTASLGVESNHSNESLVSGRSISTASSSVGSPSTSQAGPWVSLYLPLLVHPAPHFFMGAGPSLFHEFARVQGGPDVGDQRTTVGAGFLVGGYWGGKPEESHAADSEHAPPTRPARRFGEEGEVVLGNELVARVSSSQYAGTSSSSMGGSVQVGLDYFVAEHVSLGLFGQGSYGTTTAPDTGGNTTTSSSTSFGGGPRVGLDIPLASWLSFYPRLGIGFGGGSFDEKSAVGQDNGSTTSLWLSASAPLLVHVAPHFFTGFGPSISHDLAETVTFPNGASRNNPATTIGAGLLVGGWL